MHIHPDYVSNTLLADIAILILSEPVALSDITHPICLPQSHEQDTLAIGLGSIGEVRKSCTAEMRIDLFGQVRLANLN